MICRSEGLVVRGYRMSESSKVAVVFTRDNGKVRLAAKGARRPKSKFGASLEPITRGIYVYYRRENRDLQTLSDGDILDPYPGIKQDYGRLAYASAVCDLLDAMTVEEDRNPLLYSVAVDSLKWVETAPRVAAEAPLWYFQLRAASALGYRPHLSGCVRCGSRISGAKVRFNPSLGGVLCSRCGAQGQPLARRTIDFLEHLQTHVPANVDLSGFAEEIRIEARRMLRTFLDYHMPNRGRLRAFDFLDRVMAAEGPASGYLGVSTEKGGELP